MNKHYRYILSGIVNPEDTLSDYRLIGGCYLGNHISAIRVTLDESIVLEKCSCDSYSTTESDKKLKDLSPVVMLRCNGKFVISHELTEKWLNNKVQPHEFSDERFIASKFGFLTEKQYIWSSKNYLTAWKYDRIPIDNKGNTLDIPEPDTKKIHADDMRKFKKLLSSQSIRVLDNDVEMEYWYHRCCEYFHTNRSGWVTFDKIDPERFSIFTRPYKEHIECLDYINEI